MRLDKKHYNTRKYKILLHDTKKRSNFNSGNGTEQQGAVKKGEAKKMRPWDIFIPHLFVLFLFFNFFIFFFVFFIIFFLLVFFSSSFICSYFLLILSRMHRIVNLTKSLNTRKILICHKQTLLCSIDATLCNIGNKTLNSVTLLVLACAVGGVKR